MTGSLMRMLIYLLLCLAPLPLVIWRGAGSEGFVYEAGRNAALAAFMILFAQVLLAARFKWIERPFGLDVLLRFHKYMAVAAAAFLICHPLLLALGSGRIALLISLEQPWYIWMGKAAFLLLLIHAAASLFFHFLPVSFERWRLLHDIMAPLIIVLAFIHSLFAGADLQQPFLRLVWSGLLAVFLAVYAWHRLIRPHRLKQNAWEVKAVTSEGPGVWTVRLSPPQGAAAYDYLPGQFHFLTFLRGRSMPEEEHHWTISSSPSEKGFVTSTIKELGDFTATIKKTRPGDKAAVHGPFGRFSYALHPEENNLVFVAGGIGITPLMAMLRHMRDTEDERQVTLLYGNPDLQRAIFRDELEEIEKGGVPRLKVVHILSEPVGSWSGEAGFIDGDKISRHCGSDLGARVFYVCGPRPLTAKVVAALQDMGVSHGQIRIEIFSFID